MSKILLALVAAAALSTPGYAHQTSAVDELDVHANTDVSEAFPVDLGGPFELVDHNETVRKDSDFSGRYLLVFFGYTECKNMCSIGLRRMTEAIEYLGDKGDVIQPLMITVDPATDTPKIMRHELPKIHPRLLGLTGSAQALSQVYAAYRIKPRDIGPDSQGDSLVNHTSYVYLVGPDGRFLTLIPPIISGERMGDIVTNYMSLYKNEAGES